MARRTEVGLVYATGLVQGLALVTFPAASSIFTSPDGYGFSASRFFPLCISLSGQEFPQFAAAMSGELVAFYQAGYGVGAFGVGPLRDLTGRPLGTIYTLGSLVAAAMLAVALAVVASRARARV